MTLLKDEVYQSLLILQMQIEGKYRLQSQFCTNDYDINEKNAYSFQASREEPFI